MTDYVAIPQFTGLGNPLSTDTVNRLLANQDFFRTPPQALYTRSLAAGNYTVGTTEADIDGTNMNHTIITTGNPIICQLYAGKIGESVAGQVIFELMIDGVDQGGGLGIAVYYLAGTAYFRNVNIILPIFNLSAGSHTFRWRWFTNVGTATMYSANLIQSYIKEG